MGKLPVNCLKNTIIIQATTDLRGWEGGTEIIFELKYFSFGSRERGTSERLVRMIFCAILLWS